MKSIKISMENVSKITAALAAVNGKATSHTLTDGTDVLTLAQVWEAKLAALIGCKKHMPGAKVSFVSGDSVPNAYKYQRVGTQVVLERCSSDWFLVSIYVMTIHQKGGSEDLYLTQKQDAQAIEVLRRGYRTMAAKKELKAA